MSLEYISIRCCNRNSRHLALHPTVAWHCRISKSALKQSSQKLGLCLKQNKGGTIISPILGAGLLCCAWPHRDLKQGRHLSALEVAHLPHNPLFTVKGSVIPQAYAVSQLLLSWLFSWIPKNAPNKDLKDGTVRQNFGSKGAPGSLCLGQMQTSETPPPVQRTGLRTCD
jgi:hypothetical protein